MTVYYKATRPDGRDFYSGAVDYAAALASGERLRAAKRGLRRCCTDTVLHASTVPAETLGGGRWPCRLFAVTGRPVAESRHKRGFVTLRVVEELPAWQALGPNGQAVAALVDRIRHMTLRELDVVGDAARGPAKGRVPAAWDAARDAAWYAARDAAWDAAWYAARDAARGAARDAARGAARDAILALVVADLLAPKDYRTLTYPLASVIGPEWFEVPA